MFDPNFLSNLASQIADQVIAQISAQGGNGIQPRLMDTEQAARYLGLPSASSLRQRKCMGQIPEYCYTKMGGSVMYDRIGLDRWIEEMKSNN